MNNKIDVNGIKVTLKSNQTENYISLTDIAKFKNSEEPRFIVYSWLRNKDTVLFLGLWEILNNPNFNRNGFDTVKNEAGVNAFSLSPQKWIDNTNAIGITVSAGRYNSGIFAHQDIAFEFASWVSYEFKLYLIKEFQRLKIAEQKELAWTSKRELAKVNYHIHTDAIKEYLIVPTLTPLQINFIYANEADVLNVSLFGKTAKQWRDDNPDKEGNIRDFATIEQLLVIANMESYNAALIEQDYSQSKRLELLNTMATNQLKTLLRYNLTPILK